MFSNRVIKELEDAALENPQGCVAEIQSSSGRVFTLELSQGHADEVAQQREERERQRQQSGGQPASQQYRSARQSGQAQEWKVTKISPQQQSQPSGQYRQQ